MLLILSALSLAWRIARAWVRSPLLDWMGW